MWFSYSTVVWVPCTVGLNRHSKRLQKKSNPYFQYNDYIKNNKALKKGGMEKTGATDYIFLKINVSLK